MSNHPPRFFALAVLTALPAAGQSPALLDAVRAQASDATALARVELDRCEARPGCDARALSLLVGLLVLSEGDPARAAAQISRRAPPPGLRPFWGSILGTAQAYSGERKKALSTLKAARKGAPGWLDERLALRIAELEVEVGVPARARATLAVARPGPEVLYTRARMWLALGDRTAARADLEALWTGHPLHPHADLAEAALESLGPTRWTDAQLLERAGNEVALGAHRRALDTMARLAGPGDEARVALLEGQALLGVGSPGRGEARLEDAAKDRGPAGAEALMVLARRAMRAGQNERAQALFTRLEREHPAHRDADEAGYLAAWLFMNTGAYARAVDAFTGFEAAHPRSRRADEARWFRGFSLVRLGRWDEATEVLESLGRSFPRSSLVPQARYWAARAAQLAGERSDGGVTSAAELAASYRAVVDGFPGSFYARLAMERLDGLGLPVDEPFPALGAAERDEVAIPPSLALAARLSRAGLFAHAAAEVDAVVQRVGDARTALAVGRALQSLGHYGAAYTLAARHLWGAAYTEKREEALMLLYPQAWRGPVETSAASTGVSPYYAWAIMRRESAFRPEVTSVANARGLMQLIPPTASRIAQDTEVAPPHPDALYGPELNVRFGTTYLKALFQRLGHPTLVAAAYNGGPQAVVGWVAARQTEPLDEWIEQIPYKETRGYVKQVVADYFIYRRLYGQGPERLSLTLPTPKRDGVNY